MCGGVIEAKDGASEGRESGRAKAGIEPLVEIKKKSFSQSARAAVQSSDLICFQEQFCRLLSCCASTREGEGDGLPGGSLPHKSQMSSLCWLLFTMLKHLFSLAKISLSYAKV